MTARIRQLNATYVRPEDRVLLRVAMSSGDEMRFWLTRACLAGFFRELEAWLAPGDGSVAAALASFKREAAAARADFATPLEAGSSFPLGEAPVLVETARIDTAEASVRIVMNLADRRTVSFNINEEFLSGMHRLLQQAIGAADWGLLATPAARPAMRLH